jgi:cytochrome bd-type quinol oxidase subunit 2
MPSTAAGKWAGRVLLLSAALFAAFFGLIASGQRGGETFFSNLWLSATMLPAAVAAVTAGVFGVGALRRRDRSVVVFLAIIVGTFVALFAIAEILFPH